MSLPAPYYIDEWVTIYHADCREILPLLPKVDLVLTDPPYAKTTAKLGKQRTEALIEMASASGRLSFDLKEALIRIARLSHHESNGQLPAAGDYLSLLAQLDNLLGGAKQQENALLSILSMMKENNSG